MAKGFVTINQDKCKGCNLCVMVCPVKIISLDKTKVNKKGYNPARIEEMDKCIACTSCGVICPDSCIIVEREVE